MNRVTSGEKSKNTHNTPVIESKYRRLQLDVPTLPAATNQNLASAKSRFCLSPRGRAKSISTKAAKSATPTIKRAGSQNDGLSIALPMRRSDSDPPPVKDKAPLKKSNSARGKSLDVIFQSDPEKVKDKPNHLISKKEASALKAIKLDKHLDKVKLEQQLNHELEKHIQHLLSVHKKEILLEVDGFVNNKALKISGITQHLQEALKSVDSLKAKREHFFLSSFALKTDLRDFLISFHHLRKREKNVLQKLLGNDLVPFIGKYLGELSIIYAKKYILLHKQVSQLYIKTCSLMEKFNNEQLLSIGRTDIIDSFRGHYFENAPAPAFAINGYHYSFPKNEDTVKEQDQIYKCIKGLIAELNSALGISDYSFIDQQTALLCTGTLSKSRINTMIAHLNCLIQKHGQTADKILDILRELNPSICPKNFPKWLGKNFKKYINNKDMENTLAASLVNRYEEYRWFKKGPHHIPCLFILKALSMNAFAQAHLIMKTDSFERKETHFKIKSVPIKQAAYTIKIEPFMQFFSATQKKEFQILDNNKRPCASIRASWEIRGRTVTEEFAATLSFENLSFERNLPIEVRLSIVEFLISLLSS